MKDVWNAVEWHVMHPVQLMIAQHKEKGQNIDFRWSKWKTSYESRGMSLADPVCMKQSSHTPSILIRVAFKFYASIASSRSIPVKKILCSKPSKCTVQKWTTFFIFDGLKQTWLGMKQHSQGSYSTSQAMQQYHNWTLIVFHTRLRKKQKRVTRLLSSTVLCWPKVKHPFCFFGVIPPWSKTIASYFIQT